VKCGKWILLPEENSALISFLPFILSAFDKPNNFLLQGRTAILSLPGSRLPAVSYLSSFGGTILSDHSWFSCGGENRGFSAFFFGWVDKFASCFILHKKNPKSSAGFTR